MTTCAACGSAIEGRPRFCTRCGVPLAVGQTSAPIPPRAESIPGAIRPPVQQQAEWIEPATLLPLRFGGHRGRHLAAVLLLFSGGLLIQLGSVYTREVLVLGSLATLAGWVVVPSTGWRRAVAVAPAFLGVAALLNGAASGGLLVLTLAGWLLVRLRPLLSYLVLVIPIAAAAGLASYFPQYDSRVIVVGAMGAVVAGAAWLARSLAASPPRPLRALFQRRHSDRPLT